MKEIRGTLNPADFMTTIINYATLDKHFEKLGLVDVRRKSGTRVGDRAEDVHAREQVWQVRSGWLSLCRREGEHARADVAGAYIHPKGR